MARCEECLHFEVCEALEQGNGLMKVHPIHCGYYKPTADVVPRAEVEHWKAEAKQEVARESIDVLCELHDHFKSVGDIREAFAMLFAIAELKKKYTEEGK